MSGMAEYTIRQDYDRDGDLTADADPLDAYLTYREYVQLGRVHGMGFTLADFRKYIASLDRPLG